MKKRASALAAGIALLAPVPLPASGPGVEHRAGIVYDQGVVTSARIGNRQMAFYGIEGSAKRLAEAPAVVARALASVRGVNPKSLRISMDANALSFSYDRRTSSARVAAALDAALAALDLRVVPLEGFNPASSPRATRS